MGDRVFTQLFPARLFEEPYSIPIQINSVVVTGTAAATNATVVAAVTGMSIRVLSILVSSAGVASSTTLKNGSGGASLLSIFVPANTVASPNVFLENGPYGMCETGAGVALVMDTGAGANTTVSVRYITFTPATA